MKCSIEKSLVYTRVLPKAPGNIEVNTRLSSAHVYLYKHFLLDSIDYTSVRFLPNISARGCGNCEGKASLTNAPSTRRRRKYIATARARKYHLSPGAIPMPGGMRESPSRLRLISGASHGRCGAKNHTLSRRGELGRRGIDLSSLRRIDARASRATATTFANDVGCA